MASSQLRSTIARRVYRSRTIRHGARSSPPVRRSPGTRNLACFCDSFISQRIGLAANPTFLWGPWRVSTIWAFELWRSRRTEVTECTEVTDLNTEPRSSGVTRRLIGGTISRLGAGRALRAREGGSRIPGEHKRVVFFFACVPRGSDSLPPAGRLPAPASASVSSTPISEPGRPPCSSVSSVPPC